MFDFTKPSSKNVIREFQSPNYVLKAGVHLPGLAGKMLSTNRLYRGLIAWQQLNFAQQPSLKTKFELKLRFFRNLQRFLIVHKLLT